ncbi:MAG: hypothetical protein OXF55_01170 [Caldilineaceae bacterium]|nr:hypothetical protein [Caldilineaceae bacterium]
MAIVGTVENELETKVVVRQMLYEAAVESAGSQASVPIPFLVEVSGIGQVKVGFASHEWVVDVFEWLLGGEVPDQMVSRLMGLLLGYGGDATAQYERMQAGQRVFT